MERNSFQPHPHSERQMNQRVTNIFEFMKSSTNGKTTIRLILIAIIVCSSACLIGSCSNKKQSQTALMVKTDGQKVAEAYAKEDWETIVSICDTLIDDKDTMNLVIPYAEALAAVGNPQKGIYLLDKKLESNPTDYFLYQTKGNVYYTMERFDSAIICYEKVISMKPTYARAYMFVGEALANYLEAAKLFVENNYLEEAMTYTSRVLILDSTNIEAIDLLELVQSVK